MPARDRNRSAVRYALERDGWTNTHDPLKMPWGRRDLYVDPGAERLLAAEKAGKRIAVEIKALLRKSDVEELEHAFGQYLVYRSALAKRDQSGQSIRRCPQTCLLKSLRVQFIRPHCRRQWRPCQCANSNYPATGVESKHG
jgi:hypothetical protein